MADNYRFDIAGAPLDKALSVATLQYQKVVGWSVDQEGKRLVLFWTSSPNAQPLPAPLEGAALVSFVEAWVNNVEPAPAPNIDGSVKLGSRVYNEAWGHVAGHWEAFIAIEPYWLTYGK